ncbi:hypothetical protein FGO68_gene4476 [Halteria grandinella]|uniref:Uncharacterized protein n=1 Tax=Halteria grandinella TaxID=5974 RepID=A0A8J8SUC9_HALGN|nr:hypothetical protein FGO68_gene4476 [Halteria grandinella]
MKKFDFNHIRIFQYDDDIETRASLQIDFLDALKSKLQQILQNIVANPNLIIQELFSIQLAGPDVAFAIIIIKVLYILSLQQIQIIIGQDDQNSITESLQISHARSLRSLSPAQQIQRGDF